MTEQTSSYTLEPFPNGKNHRMAWPAARRNYLQKAATAFNNTIDRTGLIYYLVEYEVFHDISFQMCHLDGIDEWKAFEPFKKPDYEAFYNGHNGSRRHDEGGYRHAFDLWNKCEAALISFTSKFLSSMDEVALGAIGPANARLSMTLREMMHRLEVRFGEITAGELRAERAKLRAPILSLAHFDKHLEMQATIHLLLQDNDVATCENEKIFDFQDSLA